MRHPTMGRGHVKGVTGPVTPWPWTLGATGTEQRSKTRKSCLLLWDPCSSPTGRECDN